MTDTAPEQLEDEEQDPRRVRRPAAGLTRAERRDWCEEEAARLADLEAKSRPAGFRSVVAATPPRGLGRAGRRVWRQADRQARARLVEEEAARTESDRYVGAMILLTVICVVVLVRLILAGGSDSPGSRPAPTTTPSATVSTTPIFLPPRMPIGQAG
jgi:hypothetical protein